MSDNKAKFKGNRRRGRPPKSGAYSPICRQEFLDEYPEIRRYIQGSRDGLIEDRLAKSGGKTEDDLTAAEGLMIDRQVSKLAVSRQIEVYLKRHGILRRDQLKRRQILEPEPILVYWLQLQNSIDRGLVALGLEKPKRAGDEPFDIIQYAAKTYPNSLAAGQGGDGQGKAEKGAGACVGGGGQASDENVEAESAREDNAEGGGDE